MKKIPDVLIERVKELEDYYSRFYPAIVPMVKNCFLNTIETTIDYSKQEGGFVITGDIPAMWLRDSAAQVTHYIRYAKQDEELADILSSVVKKQTEQILIDPYANAFNRYPDGGGFKDKTKLNDWVWERKYEVDSLCAPIFLAYKIYRETGISSFFTEQFYKAMEIIADQWKLEQNHEKSDYYFERMNCPKSDTLPDKGRGTTVAYTGMTWSGFRPSDDSCMYGYLVPSNMMACVALGYMSEISGCFYRDEILRNKCLKLKTEIESGIRNYAVIEHEIYGKIYVYETDGMGHYNLMDDANSPSLLAAPYINFCGKENVIYQNTRSFVLSEDNPYYVKGKFASGIGSPHTPKGYIWHIGIIMQALTSRDESEIVDCIAMLVRTHANTFKMHESFDPSRPAEYTRPWFAWANSLFGELIDKLAGEHFFDN